MTPLPAQAAQADTVSPRRHARKSVVLYVLVATVLVGALSAFAWPRDRSAELQARVQEHLGPTNWNVVVSKQDGTYTITAEHFYEYGANWSPSDPSRAMKVDLRLNAVHVGSFDWVDGKVARTRRDAEYVDDDSEGFRQHIEHFGAKFGASVNEALDDVIR